MPSWDEMRAAVVVYTNRPQLVAEMNTAIKTAIQTAHRSAAYWRDLVSATATPTVEPVQSVDLSVTCPRFRGLAYVKSSALDKFYRPVNIQDLLDEDNYAREDICYSMGTQLKIRSSTPEESYEIGFYQYPIVNTAADVTDWLFDEHEECVYLFAAATILGMVGEQEIKQRVEALTAVAFANLQATNIELEAR